MALRTDNLMTANTDLPTGNKPPPAKYAQAAFKEIPVLDFSLAKTNPEEYMKQLMYATRDVGFMVLSNVPGFEAEFQETVFQQGHAFFDMPDDFKLLTDIRNSPHFRGSARQDRVKDLRLNINIHAIHFGYDHEEFTDKSVPLWKRILQGPNQWPDAKALPNFRPVITEYFDRCESLGRQLMKDVVKMLGVDVSYATRYFEDVADPTDLSRYATINHYPPVHEIPEERRIELEQGYIRGIQAHRDDFNLITMLIQDENGLEVLSHDGTWVDVPLIPGTVVVNLGLVLAELTGGLLQATTHRVNSLKINKRRITVPYFLTPAPDVPLLPIPHGLPVRPAVVDPMIVLANAITNRSLRYVHRRMAILYKNAETFWPEEWKTLNELLKASQQVYLLQAKLQPSLAIHGSTETEDWKARL